MTSSEPKVRQIRKILVANRGEIAARIIRTATRMGISTIGLITNNDNETKATETEYIGGDDSSSVFLNAQALIQIAKKHHADAIHPGYGYLSENGDFARLVEEAGLIFIGPSYQSIISMGNKNTARKIAADLNIPIAKATNGSIANIMANSHNLTYPILVKAAAGGGGKGMLTVNNSDELNDKLLQTSREALKYFGDGSVFVEQFIEGPRHIEVQVLGDKHGNLLHLFERECSIQRRYQKIIEESPAPGIDHALRDKLTRDALKICRVINYHNAGTVEFLVDKDGNHFFLEMNTRIQVEHPVTEMVTGIDLVEQQLRIAMGLPLLINQNGVQLNGHALECRIYAEDAENNFTPSPGKVHRTQWPCETLARTDTWFNHPVNISSDYDPMVAKLITHGSTRFEAISKAISALESTHLTGLTTNINYLKSILLETDFNQGALNTGYCQTHYLPPVLTPETNVLAAAYLVWLMNYVPPGKKIGYWRITNQTFAIISDQKLAIKWHPESDLIHFAISNHPSAEINQVRFTDDAITFIMNGNLFSFDWCLTPEGILILEHQHKPNFITPGFTIDKVNLFQKKETTLPDAGNQILQAPIPGKITNILIAEGAMVKKGDRLMTLVAMKMENHLSAQNDGIIETILTKNGQQVKARDLLATIRPILESSL